MAFVLRFYDFKTQVHNMKPFEYEGEKYKKIPKPLGENLCLGCAFENDKFGSCVDLPDCSNVIFVKAEEEE